MKKIAVVEDEPLMREELALMLRKAGYEVEQAGCVDMFPGTVHVETVALLSRS